MFDQKVLMITGGTGSFGKAVLKRFLSTNVSEIRIFSRDEKKQEEMRLKFNNHKQNLYKVLLKGFRENLPKRLQVPV